MKFCLFTYMCVFLTSVIFLLFWLITYRILTGSFVLCFYLQKLVCNLGRYHTASLVLKLSLFMWLLLESSLSSSLSISCLKVGGCWWLDELSPSVTVLYYTNTFRHWCKCHSSISTVQPSLGLLGLSRDLCHLCDRARCAWSNLALEQYVQNILNCGFVRLPSGPESVVALPRLMHLLKKLILLYNSNDVILIHNGFNCCSDVLFLEVL